MGKTTVCIKPKISLTKRTNDQPDTGINRSKQTYSLISSNTNLKIQQRTNVVTPIRNTIVQLKITQNQVEYYERYGDWENFTLLNNIKKITPNEPSAYNDTVNSEFGLDMSEKHEISDGGKQEVTGLSSIIKMPKNLSSTDKIKQQTELFKPETQEEIEHRRNLIINSGICRKLHKIMSAFNDSPWPNYSPYKCWYCCYPFNTAPVGIPESLQADLDDGSDDVKYSFKLYGNFCSYNCAARYLSPCNNDDHSLIINNLDFTQADQRSEQMQLLDLLCHLETNLDINDKIKLAPSRLCLKDFGGELTIEEFRENFDQHDEYHIYKTPLVPITYQMEISTGLKHVKKPRKVKTIDHARIEKAYQVLNKQRNKLKNSVTNILKLNVPATKSQSQT